MAARFRAVFFGTPEIAVPALRALCEVAEVPGVVCQPDRPSGRGMRLRAPAVKVAARELGLPVHQPERVRSGELQRWLQEQDADVALVMAYGRILPPDVLATPRRGCLNLHASLLPKYRGAAPIQWALIEGETQTGVTIMQTDVGLDTGPVRLQRRVAVAPSDDAVSLLHKLSLLGAETLLEALGLLGEGTLPLAPQNDAAATLAPPLTPEDGWVRWQEPARRVVDRHRGVAAWPGSSFGYQDQRVKVEAMSLVENVATEDAEQLAPGTVQEVAKDGLLVATGRGAVLLESVKPPGKRAMNARDWANGRAIKRGTRLG